MTSPAKTLRPASPPGALVSPAPQPSPPPAKPVATAVPPLPPAPTPRTTAPISLSAIGDLLPRRVPRMHGIAIIALLSGATLAAALVLARLPQPAASVAGTGTRASGAINFQMAGSQAMTLQGLASQSAPGEKASEPQPSIRIIDQPAEKIESCEDSIWPYIEQRCLTMKPETDGNASAKSELKSAAKIGPKPVDTRPPPAAAPDQPIGSMTAIAPAHPRGDATTDGLSSDPPEARIVEPVYTAAPIGEPAAKARKSARARYAATDRSERASVSRKKAKEKKYRDVADAPRRYSYRPSIDREPGFFFPFGLFTQMR